MFKRLVAVCFLALVSITSYAQTGVVSGTVNIIRSHDISVASTWFQLNVSSAGNCGIYGNKVIFKIRDDDRGKQQLSMVIAAKMANQPVTVSYDDVNLVGGQFCYVRYVDL